MFGIVDTLGLLIAVAVMAANTSDNAGGIAVVDRARQDPATLGRSGPTPGSRHVFAPHCRSQNVDVEVVNRIHAHLRGPPQAWIVERTWSWLMNNRRLQIDYERDPKITEGFIWAAHSRLLLRRLTA